MKQRIRSLFSPLNHRIRWLGASVLLGALAGWPVWTGATAPEVAPPTTPIADPIDELTEIMVEAREPRYVSPTRRDQIGRIWAPVMINGHGPFRLVLDTGASHSAITALVALALGIPTDRSPPVILRGVTGFATVPTIRVDTLSVGDVAVDQAILPIVPDALGGAEGVLGSEGLVGKRIFIDFRHDKINIAYSKNERAAPGFINVPFHSLRGTLVVVDAFVGQVRCKAIIDTGGQVTIANLALKEALSRIGGSSRSRIDTIIGATKDIQKGELMDTPAIGLGAITIHDPGVTFGDLYIFKQWRLTSEPAILIGMDTLGLLDTLIIDYRRHELQLRMLNAS
ncbi:MAG TPA: retropepsin-like aspartic protease [Steroidobacteraceae bacterium]|nr:retropepsin-like aspartic protease [Steroidobacteraceae bacterium]